ncbi:GAF domain-containing protein, partial [Candidatus Ruminimicrobium bovinum]|uniref:GAF domain-containing protein n=1 Tax=Candidatus Ruminimicrobium bovinum TaxID=3242779 RepID=UPI0039B93E5A
MAIIKKESSNIFFDDLLKTVVLPLLSGICFIIWLFYFCKYPIEIFPTIFVIFLAVYFLSDYILGGIFFAFIISVGLVSFLFIRDYETITLLSAEILLLTALFILINYSRTKYIEHKKHFYVEYELLDRDIAIINSSVKQISKRNETLKKRTELFKNFEKFIIELEKTLKEKEVLKLTEQVIKDFIRKGNWKIKKYSSTDIFAKHIKETKTPIILDDVKKYNKFNNPKHKKPTSVIAVPIDIDGNFWGIIKGTCENSQFDNNDLRFLSVISSIIGIILNNAILFDKVEELSITDSLTGLYTRKYFMERLKEEVTRYLTNTVPLVIAML